MRLQTIKRKVRIIGPCLYRQAVPIGNANKYIIFVDCFLLCFLVSRIGEMYLILGSSKNSEYILPFFYPFIFNIYVCVNAFISVCVCVCMSVCVCV